MRSAGHTDRLTASRSPAAAAATTAAAAGEAAAAERAAAAEAGAAAPRTTGPGSRRWSGCWSGSRC